MEELIIGKTNLTIDTIIDYLFGDLKDDQETKIDEMILNNEELCLFFEEITLYYLENNLSRRQMRSYLKFASDSQIDFLNRAQEVNINLPMESIVKNLFSTKKLKKFDIIESSDKDTNVSVKSLDKIENEEIGFYLYRDDCGNNIVHGSTKISIKNFYKDRIRIFDILNQPADFGLYFSTLIRSIEKFSSKKWIFDLISIDELSFDKSTYYIFAQIIIINDITNVVMSSLSDEINNQGFMCSYYAKNYLTHNIPFSSFEKDKYLIAKSRSYNNIDDDSEIKTFDNYIEAMNQNIPKICSRIYTYKFSDRENRDVKNIDIDHILFDQ